MKPMRDGKRSKEMSDLIKKSDAIKVLKDSVVEMGGDDFCEMGVHIDDIEAVVNAIPSADRPQGWVDKAISIIDDMQREGIIDYEQAWEFRMRARMKGADDEVR